MMRIYVHRDERQHPVSIHELNHNKLYPAFKKDSKYFAGWTTRLFLDCLQGLPDSNKYFEIRDWQQHIPLSQQGYYLLHYGNPQTLINNTGFVCLPAEVRDQINDGSLTLLVVYVYETFDHEYSIREWQNNFCSLLNELGIDRVQSVKVLFSGQSKLMHEHRDPRVSWIFYPWLEAAMQSEAYLNYTPSNDLPLYDPAAQKKYKFLSLNRAARPHRILMLAMFEFLKISDSGFITWPVGNDQLTKIPEYFNSFSMGIKRMPEFEKFLLTNKRLSDKYFDSTSDGNHLWGSAMPLYKQADFEIVNETYHCNIGDVVFLTEKTFRSLWAGIPFMLHGTPGSLKLLRDLGYKTFDMVFDESYDNVYSPMHTIELIAMQTRSLVKLDPLAPNPLRQPEIAEIIKHNRNNFWSKTHANNLWNAISNS
jgi:hypothetical protein